MQQTARARATQQDTSLTLNDEKVLAMLDIDGRLTAPRIAKNLNISESTVRRSFRRLRDLGLIDRVGSTSRSSGRFSNPSHPSSNLLNQI